MASPQGIKAGAAFIELTANDNKLVRGLRSAQRRLKAFGSSARAAGASALKMTGLFAAPFVAGARVFGEFQDQMAMVSTMLADPAVHMDRFRKGIRSMSVEFGEGTGTLAKGLFDILSASVPAEQALDVLTVSVKAAKAGMTDTAVAADAITTVLNAYSLSAEEAGSVSDLLFSIVKRGKTTFAELAPSIGNVATIANRAGVSLNELGAMIALLTRNGIKTDIAMTNVKGVISGFLKPTDDAAKLARSLGFELNSTTLKTEGLAGVMKKLQGVPPDVLAKIFPNVRGLTAVLVAMKGLDKDVKAMGARAGATDEAFTKMTKSLSFSFAQLKQAGIGVLSLLGEAIAEPISKAATIIRRMVNTTREWAASNQELIGTVAKVVLVLGLAGAALFSVGLASAALSLALGGIAAIIGGVGTAIAFLVTAIGAILSPIGLVIVGLVALTGWILHATGAGGRALAWLAGRFARLKDDATAALKGIADALVAGDIALAARILWLTLKMEWQRGVHFLRGLWASFKQFFLAQATGAFFGAVALLVDAWAALETAWIQTTTFLKNSWTRFTTGLQLAWNKAQQFLQTKMAKLMAFFDKKFKLKDVTQQINREFKENERKIAAAGEREIAANEARGKGRRRRVERQREAAQSEIGKAAGAAERERRREQTADLDKSQSELDKARAEWQKAIAEAGKARAKAEADEKAPRAGEKPKLQVPDVVKKLTNQLGGVGKKLEQADTKARAQIAGTFSAAIAQMLGGPDDVAERTAQSAEQTAKNTKKLLQESRNKKAVFV